ncbi:hypothetical protein ACFXCZ_27255 [Streptomyces sp. NPDC059396]|uniref:hypothetical protein n=1 Tax=Streptomyces sp. NPDC059396 TaxID=3346819 RepID=UPI0036C8C114
MSTTQPTAAENLWTVARHWADLDAALTARTPAWPPAMGIPTRDHRSDDEAEAATWRAEALRLLERDPTQPGWTAAPLRLGTLDVLRTVEAALIELADQTAAAVQRAVITPSPARRARPPRMRGSGFDFPARLEGRAGRVQAADDRRRDLLAFKDSRDPRRWYYASDPHRAEDDPRRTVPRAALWLLARVQHAPGPVHRQLTPVEGDRIASVARAAARAVEHVLDVGDEHVVIMALCPDCGGRLTMYGGGGALPVVHCRSCGHIW